MSYPHTIEVKEIPIPEHYTQVVISSDFGSYTTKKEFYASPEDFLEFWKPLVTYYEALKNDQHTSKA